MKGHPMTDKKIKRCEICLAICFAVMLAALIPTFDLIPARTPGDLDRGQRIVFSILAAIGLASAVAGCFFVRIWQQLRRKADSTNGSAEQTPDKQQQKKSSVADVCAFCTVTAVFIAGISLSASFGQGAHTVLRTVFLVCFCLPLAATLTGYTALRIYSARMNSLSVAEANRFMISHRDEAEKTAAGKLRLLRFIRIASGIYAVLLAVCGIGTAFTYSVYFPVSYKNLFFVAAELYAFVLIRCAASRIRLPEEAPDYSENKDILPENDFPALYALARRAAEKNGYRGQIRIFVTPDCNAGILTPHGGICAVLLGTLLLDIMSEDEIYCILLHEFSHISPETLAARKATGYAANFDTNGDYSMLNALSRFAFVFPDTIYGFELGLFLYTSSVISEASADRAMAKFGDRAAVASSLIKLYFSNMYEWASGTEDDTNDYESEELHGGFVFEKQKSFRRMTDAHSEEWKKYIATEILANDSSHPTAKMRLDAIGITEYRTLDNSKSDELRRECEAATEIMDNAVTDSIRENYAEIRQRNYLDPLSRIEKWEADGKPLVAEDYGDIIDDLRTLGRNAEALELCDRAINELPVAASCRAYFIKGAHLIHSFDPAGIEYIYHAVENNKNYIDEGMDMIGAFCCITGRQDDLDICRKKSIELAQKQQDEYNDIGELAAKDDLSAEHLPDGMLDDILAHIHSADAENNITGIRLVRKTISPELFTSAFVIRFAPCAGNEEKYRTMHKIFMYLDTCSDWQFSLFECGELDSDTLKAVDAVPDSEVYTRRYDDGDTES